MNAQSNHPISDTTDPQFLGPEAGQQAGGGRTGKGGLDANLEEYGSELHRYFSLSRGALISVRSHGVNLYRGVDDDWKVLSRMKADCSLDQWRLNKQALVASLERWQREVEELPSLKTLMAWDADGICETPTGHRVEPDGNGPDGVPSWLRVLRLI